MNHEKAEKKAKEIVFLYYTLGDIIHGCEIRGIQTLTPKGRIKSRYTLEEKLIKAMTKEFEQK